MLRSLCRFAARAAALTAVLSAPPCFASITIAEVLYDADGADDEREWIELWNAGDTPVDLSTWSLGWGGTSLVSGRQALSGVVDAGARFLVGGPLGDFVDPTLAFDLAIDLEPDLQNSGATADAVALFDLPADAVTAETLPFDVVLYGESNDSALLGPTGDVAAVDVADAPSGASIERGFDGVWRVQPEPTPGAPPRPVPEPGPTSLSALGAAAAFGLHLTRRYAAPRAAGDRTAKH
jgi:hypothetical protein